MCYSEGPSSKGKFSEHKKAVRYNVHIFSTSTLVELDTVWWPHRQVRDSRPIASYSSCMLE